MVETMQSLKYVLIFKKETGKLSSGKVSFWETGLLGNFILGNFLLGKFLLGNFLLRNYLWETSYHHLKAVVSATLTFGLKPFFNLSVVSILFLFMVQTRYRQIYVYNIS